jgi:hypothetical protein
MRRNSLLTVDKDETSGGRGGQVDFDMTNTSNYLKTFEGAYEPALFDKLHVLSTCSISIILY